MLMAPGSRQLTWMLQQRVRPGGQGSSEGRGGRGRGALQLGTHTLLPVQTLHQGSRQQAAGSRQQAAGSRQPCLAAASLVFAPGHRQRLGERQQRSLGAAVRNLGAKACRAEWVHSPAQCSRATCLKVCRLCAMPASVAAALPLQGARTGGAPHCSGLLHWRAACPPWLLLPTSDAGD